ncbi:MAG: hypothetical protein WCG03_07390 [Kiritimatiellales bacterium]
MRIQHRILKMMIIITSLIGGLVLSASANLLTNGSFETQIPVTNKPAGWATTLDGTYWQGYTTQPSATNMVFKTNSFAAVDGAYYIRRYSYAGTPVGTASFSSVSYNLSALSLPAGTTLALSLQTVNTSAGADTGKLATYGSLVFYSGSNGTGSVLGTYETSRLLSSSATAWVQLSVMSFIPASALSFKVNGNLAIYQTNSSAASGQRFDGFNLEAVDSLLTNGSFETQPLGGSVSNRYPSGWATQLDGVYWYGLCDDTSKTNLTFRYTTTLVTTNSGNYWINRSCPATPGVTSTFSTVAYRVDALPSGTAGIVLSLDSCAAGQAGLYKTHGVLSFFASTNGTGTALAVYETDHLVSTAAPTSWTTLSLTSSIPLTAQSYTVGGRYVSFATTSYVYPRFDNFKLRAVSEIITPPRVSLFLIK